MAAGVRKVNLDKTIKKYKDAEKKLDSNELITAVLSTAKAIIVQRTLDGKDVNGKPFKEYSPLYKKTRSRKGRSSKVNLADSGRMLAGIAPKVMSSTKGMLYFPRGEDGFKASCLFLQGRDFFGLSKADMQTLSRKCVRPFLKNLIK